MDFFLLYIVGCLKDKIWKSKWFSTTSSNWVLGRKLWNNREKKCQRRGQWNTLSVSFHLKCIQQSFLDTFEYYLFFILFFFSFFVCFFLRLHLHRVWLPWKMNERLVCLKSRTSPIGKNILKCWKIMWMVKKYTAHTSKFVTIFSFKRS